MIVPVSDSLDDPNGFNIINSQLIKKIDGKKVKEKIVNLKCSDKSNSIILKWKGLVDEIYCLGCITLNKSNINNIAILNKTDLFTGRNENEVFIPFNAITECCEKYGHKTLDVSYSKVINENSICCIRISENIQKYIPFQINDLVEINNNRIYGTCRWIGVVNKIIVVGVELNHSFVECCDGTFCGIQLFQCKNNCAALFQLTDLKNARARLIQINNLDLYAIDLLNIKKIENGEQLRKTIKLKNENIEFLNIKWKGSINKESCVGCELNMDTNFGTNGTFYDKRLFNCLDKRGVIIPFYELKGSCLNSGHREIKLNINNKTMNPDYICCVERLQSIQSMPEIKIKVKIKYIIENKSHRGTCQWIGLINGHESVAVEMDDNVKGTNGRFSCFNLFTSENDNGVLLLAKDIIYDGIETNLHFFANKVIDIHKINHIKSLGNREENGIILGVPVSLNFQIDNETEELVGEVKWIGLINNEKCVGLDMEQGTFSVKFGMDGIINKIKRFDCLKGHGLVTLLENVKLESYRLHFLDDGIVNPNKYIKFVEKMNHEHLDELHVNESDIVCVKLLNGKKILQGKIKWTGLMNNESVCAIELNEYYENATNGKFWRNELFKCENNRAIATSLDNVCKYIPFSSEIIPRKIRIFKDIDVGVSVKYYLGYYNEIKELYGIVRWTGTDYKKQYYFGIELENEINGGSDGRFNEQNLFRCQSGHGILASINCVTMDMRLFENKENAILHFIVDKIVDINKIFHVKTLANDTQNGQCVGKLLKITFTLNTKNEQHQLFGEGKWIGFINNEKCVGLDMEDEIINGMNGIIDNDNKFHCMDKHGLITALKYVELDRNPLTLHFLENGIVNPNKYIECHENWNNSYLSEKKIETNQVVFIKLLNDTLKMKGFLKWSGKMNNVDVCAVHLFENHENGTNGKFWRRRLFECPNHQAIAVSLINIHKYEPYEFKIIPEADRIFAEININSVIKYFDCDSFEELYGTIKWSGINENYEYFYGIELDNRYIKGTDGQFENQRLFNCDFGFGILTSINNVGRDSRFIEIDNKNNDCPESQICTTKIGCNLLNLFSGQNIGIQGVKYSNYFHCVLFALFAKSDVLDYMLESSNNIDDTDDITQQFRNNLAREIVYPLRKFHFVSFHKIVKTNNIIQLYGIKDVDLLVKEINIENMFMILSKLCAANDNLLSILSNNQSVTNLMFLPITLKFNRKEGFITTEEILKFYMIQKEIIFNELPTCLIIHVPKLMNYCEYIIPTNIIEISVLCSKYFKKCAKCNNEAIYHCKKCMRNKFDVNSSFHCGIHKCLHQEELKMISNKYESKSKVFMELNAIICQNNIFQTYFKQSEIVNQTVCNKWYIFQNINNQSEINNFSIPKVTFAKKISDFLNMSKTEMKNTIRNCGDPDIANFTKNFHTLVYYNLSKTCY